MARYENDESVAAVFTRADRSMYENKLLMKGGAKPSEAPPSPR